MKVTCYRLWYNHRNYDIKQLRDATMILTIFCITYLDVQVRSNVETFNVLIKKHIFFHKLFCAFSKYFHYVIDVIQIMVEFVLSFIGAIFV